MIPAVIHPMLPSAIFLDTNALLQLPMWGMNPDFLKLREAASKIGAKMLVPDIVARELLQRRIEDARKCQGKLMQEFSHFNKLLNRESVNLDIPPQIESIVAVETEKYLQKLQLEIVPPPSDLDLDEIIRMALAKTPPFRGLGEKGERGDSGFKDTIILWTIKSYLNEESHFSSLLISADKIFLAREIQTFLDSRTMEVVVGFKEAIEFIEKNVRDQRLNYVEVESGRIVSYLQDHFEMISDYISQHAVFTENFLRPLLAQVEPDILYGTIERIISITPLCVSNAFPFHFHDELVEREDAETIAFSVTLEFKLLISRLPFGAYGSQVTFSLTSPEDFELNKQTSYSPIQSIQKEITVSRELMVDGYVKEKEGIFIDLEITKINSF